MAEKPWIQIRSADGYRLAWLSNEAEPTNQQDGQLGEHLDTGAKFIYYRGDWHRQSFSTDLWVSELVRAPYGATVGAIDANDALGDKMYFEWSIDHRPLPLSGRILSIRLIDQDDDTLAVTINISTRDFTAAASDAAFTISAADAQFFLQPYTFPAAMSDLGSAKIATLTDINEDYYSEQRRLVAQLSSTGTPNIAGNSTMPLVQLFILPLG